METLEAVAGDRQGVMPRSGLERKVNEGMKTRWPVEVSSAGRRRSEGQMAKVAEKAGEL